MRRVMPTLALLHLDAVKLGSLIAAHFLLSSVLGSVIAAIACILGHNYTIWLGFKGGKGIATSGGAILALLPPLVFVWGGLRSLLSGGTRRWLRSLPLWSCRLRYS